MCDQFAGMFVTHCVREVYVIARRTPVLHSDGRNGRPVASAVKGTDPLPVRL